MKRTKQREQAFSLIFERMFNDDKDLAGLYEENIEKLGDYALMLYNGVCENENEIDKAISADLKGWKITRISKANLAILRLGVYELKYVPDISDSVVINEAVELAKKYSDDNAPAFVNAVLGAIVRND